VNAERITFFKGGAKVVEKSLGGANVSQKRHIVQPMNTAGKKSCGKEW
jgi:hypothetical protein